MDSTYTCTAIVCSAIRGAKGGRCVDGLVEEA